MNKDMPQRLINLEKIQKRILDLDDEINSLRGERSDLHAQRADIVRAQKALDAKIAEEDEGCFEEEKPKFVEIELRLDKDVLAKLRVHALKADVSVESFIKMILFMHVKHELDKCS